MTRLTSFVQTIPAVAVDARMCAGACCRAWSTRPTRPRVSPA